MRDIELEEGEAYLFPDDCNYYYDDDDKNIDPDTDFSYIDRKIENVLGHFQKDFMGGLSARLLGAKFGDYGSFLPMQQRSPPILSNQRGQSHVSLKSPKDLQSEHFDHNPTAAANHLLPARSISASGDQTAEAMSESRISLVNNQTKCLSSGELTSNHQKKKPMKHQFEKNSLKFRVKVTSDTISSLDKSAIYSGLGLEMSPSSSSLEDSPSENDGTSKGLQGMDLKSPSFIVKTMTDRNLPDNDLVSPLHDSFVFLRGMESNLEAILPGTGAALSVNNVHESMYSKGGKRSRKEGKSKVKDSSKVKKSKHREASEEKKSQQKFPSPKKAELMESCAYSANIFTLSATRRDDNASSIDKEDALSAFIDEIGAYSEENGHASLMSNGIGSKPSIVFDKRTEDGCLDEAIDNPLKQACVARLKAKEEPGSTKKHDPLEDGLNAVNSRGKTVKDKKLIITPRSDSTEKRDGIGWRDDEVKVSKQHNISKEKVKKKVLDSAHSKDKNIILISTAGSNIEKRNEIRRENEVNKFLKQESRVKDKVKEEVLNSGCSIDAGVSKETGIVEIIPKDEEVCLFTLKEEENDNDNTVSQEMIYNNVETLESLKQKSHSREMIHSVADQGLFYDKENLSSVVRKKLKDGQISEFCTAEPPRGSLCVSSSAPKKEVAISNNIILSKSKEGDTNLRKEMRKNNEFVDKANQRKKGKEVSSKDLVMGISEQGTQAPTAKLKNKSSSKKTSCASYIGHNLGNLQGVNCMTEKIPVGDVPVENAPVVTLEDWVECDKCHKWRLLPLGMSAGSFEDKKWTCSMLTWLPGMNNCSFSEDETINALYASYIPMDPASVIQSNQPPHLEANASVIGPASAPNIVVSSQAPNLDVLPNGGKKKNVVKKEIEAARQSGVQDLHIPVKTDQPRYGDIRNLKNLKSHRREMKSVRKSDDGKPSKIEKKRVADVEAYGVSKKLKRVHQHPMEDSDPGALRVPRNFEKGDSKCLTVKAKDRAHSDMTSKVEIYDVSEKKRKLKDKQQHHPAVVPSGKVEYLVNSWDAVKNSLPEHRKEKSKSSKFQIRESSADKGHHRTQIYDAKSDLGGAGDSGRHKGGRSDGIPLEQYHMDRMSRKTPAGRPSSEMALDLGLSDNVTTSSSSKVSCIVKAKVHEVKFSPVGSISSSPKKVSKLDPDRGTSKKSVSYSEQQLKAGAENTINDFAPHNEGFRDRKSNLSRNSGIMSDAADEDHVGKKLSSRRYSHAMDTQPKIEDYKDRGGRVDGTYEGTLTLQQNLVAENQIMKSPNKLHCDGTTSVKGKSHVSKIDSEKEVSSNSHGAPDFDGGNGFNGGRVENVNEKPFRQVAVGHVGHSLHTRQVSNDVEASSSRKKDSYHRAAKTALREATDLKHSANRLKVSGLGLESTGIFFQAALKFLHGASLLEPGNYESRTGEMAPNEVYTSTAKLCEYCALEYERCNDMASAALAYKCMEVAYMRVVYCKDLVASRDRQELQMSVRAAPQVESPSSSASDVDNLNQASIDTVKEGDSALNHQSHVVSAGNRPNLLRLLDFAHDINLAMEATRRSQSSFAAAIPVFTQAGNEEGISSVKGVLDFSFHDVDGLLQLVRLAMESIKS